MATTAVDSTVDAKTRSDVVDDQSPHRIDEGIRLIPAPLGGMTETKSSGSFASSNSAIAPPTLRVGRNYTAPGAFRMGRDELDVACGCDEESHSVVEEHPLNHEEAVVVPSATVVSECAPGDASTSEQTTSEIIRISFTKKRALWVIAFLTLLVIGLVVGMTCSLLIAEDAKKIAEEDVASSEDSEQSSNSIAEPNKQNTTSIQQQLLSRPPT
jgi:hypothetical protein